MRVKYFVTLLFLCFFAAPLLLGQTGTDSAAKTEDEIKFFSQQYLPQEAGAIRVRSTMVPVPVVVRDSHGNVVKDLKREDFEIYDEGKSRTLLFLTLITGLTPPLRLLHLLRRRR